jgi:hypothetical protein
METHLVPRTSMVKIRRVLQEELDCHWNQASMNMQVMHREERKDGEEPQDAVPPVMQSLMESFLDTASSNGMGLLKTIAQQNEVTGASMYTTDLASAIPIVLASLEE